MFAPGTYDARRIDSELGACRLLGFNTVRVFLHDLLWAQDRAGFQSRLAQFVGIAARHGIKPLFVFFDSCWDPHPQLGAQRAPTPGVHNSGWVQSPGAQRIDDPRYRSVLRDYVVGVMSQFRNDNRVLGWDLWNEPDNPAKQYRKVERKDKIDAVGGLLPQVFGWARSVNAVQPLTSGVWQGSWDRGSRSEMDSFQLDNSDVISFHSYAGPAEFEARIAELAPLGGRSCAPSTWRETRAAPSKECFRLPSGTTSVPTAGVWWPARLRRTSHGIRGTSPTPRCRTCGSVICCSRTDGRTRKANTRRSESSPPGFRRLATDDAGDSTGYGPTWWPADSERRSQGD